MTPPLQGGGRQMVLIKPAEFDSASAHFNGVKMGYEEQFKRLDIKSIMITSIMTALAFVVGLFWRDAISETINKIVPPGEGLIYKYIAAVIATIIVAIIGYIVVKAQNFNPEALIKKKTKKK